MHAPGSQPAAVVKDEPTGPEEAARKAAEQEAARKVILAAGAKAAAEATSQLPAPVVEILEEHATFLHGTGEHDDDDV